MKRFTLALSLFAFMLTSAIAQQTTTQQLTFKLNVPSTVVSNVNTSVVGTPGSCTYYYWVVGNFTVGNGSPSGPVAMRTSNCTLSVSNYNVVGWQPSPGAATYDVLRTTTPTAPSGACACAVATGVSGIFQADHANALNPYTVSTFDPNTLQLTLRNEGVGSGDARLILYIGNPQTTLTQVADLTVAGNAFVNGGVMKLSEGACSGAAAGLDLLCADSTLHAFKSSLNNGAFTAIPQLAGDIGGMASSPTVPSTHIAGATNTRLAAFNATGNVVNTAVSEAAGLLNTNADVLTTPSNKVVLTADWTCGTGGTVADCNTAAVIVGSGGGVPLMFPLPLVAASYYWECNLIVGQATAAVANTWSILTATNGATNVTAAYDMYTAATAKAGGAVTDEATTTTAFAIAPNWTLGGTGTKMPVRIWGSIEGASASGTVLSLLLTNGANADLITIYRGSECHIQ